MLELQHCSRLECGSLLSHSDFPGTVCGNCQKLAPSESQSVIMAGLTRPLDGSEVISRKENNALGSISSSSALAAAPKLNFRYDTSDSYSTFSPAHPSLYPGHPSLVRGWTADRPKPAVVRGWNGNPQLATHLSYPKPSHSIRVCSRRNCGNIISANGVRRGDVQCKQCRKQQNLPAIPSPALTLPAQEPLVRASYANIEPEVINLVTDDDEMNLDLMYPEEEDTPLKAAPTSETGASSLEPRPVVQEHPTNVAPTTIASSSVVKLCISPDCKNVTTSASLSRCMTCIRKNWISRKKGPSKLVPTAITSISGSGNMPKRRKSVHWADELEYRELSATRSSTPETSDEEPLYDAHLRAVDAKKAQIDRLAALTSALQALRTEHTALLNMDRLQGAVLSSSKMEGLEETTSQEMDNSGSENSTEDSEDEDEVAEAPYKLYIRLPALGALKNPAKDSHESEDSDTPLSKHFQRSSSPGLRSSSPFPSSETPAVSGWDSDLTNLSDIPSSEDSDDTGSEEEISLLPKLLIRIPARTRQRSWTAEVDTRLSASQTGSQQNPYHIIHGPSIPRSLHLPLEPPLAAPEVVEASLLPRDDTAALLAASLEIGTPEEVLKMYPADTTARTCPSGRCRQRPVPPLDHYQFKHCPECRLRMRLHQRRKQPSPTERSQVHADSTDESKSELRRCSISYCSHILPSKAEYKYKMCHVCRFRTRQRASTRRANGKAADPTAALSTNDSRPAPLDNAQEDLSTNATLHVPVPDNLDLVTDTIANGPKRADGLCVSYDCGMSVLDSKDWTSAECEQCNRRRAKLDPARFPFIRGTIDAGLPPATTKRKRSTKQDVEPQHKEAKTTSTNQPRSPYPQYQSLGTLLVDFQRRFVGFSDALFLWAATPLSDPTHRGGSISVKFAFDGEYSVVALDLNLLERSASVLETIVSTARELERITGVVISSRSQQAKYGGIVARFQCELQAEQSGRMAGELEIVVLPDASYQYFPGQRSVIRFRLASAQE